MEALVSSVDLEILATFIHTVWKVKQLSTHTYIYDLPWPQRQKTHQNTNQSVVHTINQTVYFLFYKGKANKVSEMQRITF